MLVNVIETSIICSCAFFGRGLVIALDSMWQHSSTVLTLMEKLFLKNIFTRAAVPILIFIQSQTH